MSFKIKKHKDDLLFVPLGGTNEIGMNLNLYHYQGKWIVIDVGIGFADDYLPGIEVVLPDIEFLQEIKEDIVGIVITHAHEDHMGGLPYLWDELDLPIYATPFTAAVLRRKMADDGLSGKLKMKEVKPGTSIDLGPFAIDLIDLTHSIPEMQALAIKTEKGVIIHTGDWKLDPTPPVGPASDEKALEAYGDSGVLAMVCDSTNVFVEGDSGSEMDVRHQLKETVATLKHGVVVTTFASNIARVESIVRAGHEAGRKIALVGRSLHRVVAAAQESGYLQDIEFLDDKAASRIPPEELMILCTGCQGEPRAALSKIAQGSHPYLRLHKGDTVIFSSKIIPGNESRIRWIFNRLAMQGVDVITEEHAPIHVSGHPARDELKRMYQLVRPEISVPVHGEPAHIMEHAEFARTMQVPKVVESQNGAVVCLASDAEEVGVIGHVQAGYIVVDGTSMLPIDSPVIRMRRKIKDVGVLSVSVAIGKDGKIVGKPHIIAPGCLDEGVDGDLYEELADDIREAVAGMGKTGKPVKGKKKKAEKPEEKIHNAVRKTIRTELGKKPIIAVHVHHV